MIRRRHGAFATSSPLPLLSSAIRDFNLNKSANNGTLFPPSPPSFLSLLLLLFHRQYGCSRCIREKRNGSKTREARLSRSGLKILLPFARFSPLVFSSSSRSFSPALFCRSFLLAFSGSLHSTRYLALQSSSLSLSLSPALSRACNQTVALAINKKRKKNNENTAHTTRVSREWNN